MEEFQAMDSVAIRFFGNTVTQSRKPRGMYSTLSAHNIVEVVFTEPELLEAAACQTMDITLIAENGERIRLVIFGDNIQVKAEHEDPSTV